MMDKIEKFTNEYADTVLKATKGTKQVSYCVDDGADSFQVPNSILVIADETGMMVNQFCDTPNIEEDELHYQFVGLGHKQITFLYELLGKFLMENGDIN